MSLSSLFPPSLVIGASVTMVGNYATEYEYHTRKKLRESILVSIFGSLLTAASIYVAEKIEGDNITQEIPLRKKIEAVVMSAVITFIVSMAAERSGASVNTQSLLVGFSAALVWIFVHIYLF